jgi:pyridoxine 5-phosphate synthase|tara:strand:+ start:5808 stop:6539 length:732 start_codon:yes stop_codon:yes gene_type:complete
MLTKKKLGVNIDHVATVRNARGEKYPSPLRAALQSEKYGANSITIHLREDRRHINDDDLRKIKSELKIPLNLEIAPTSEMLKIALKQKPKFICIVPEKRKEITTEGGLNLNFRKIFLRKIISKLKKNGARVSLFIEPNLDDIKKSKNYFNADCIEIHTGRICNLINKKKDYKAELKKITKAANLARKLDLEVHAGHGLTYESAKILSRISNISEFNIGHYLIGEAIFLGLKKSINNFKKVINK